MATVLASHLRREGGANEQDCTGRWNRMKRTRSDIEGSIAVENTHERQLMTLLQEMVREKGCGGAARVLEIDRRTVAACMKKGRLSWRVREALERAIQYGAGSPAAEQRERNDKLESRINRLEEKLQTGLEELGGELRGRQRKHARDLHLVEARVAILTQSLLGSGTGTPASGEGGGPPPTRHGPLWLLKGPGPVDMTDLVFKWRQALAEYLAAEERLCEGMDMSMMAILRDEKKAEGPVEPRTPRAALRSPLRSKRKRVRSETAEGAQAEKGNREVAGGDGSTAVVNGGTAADPPVR